MTIQASGERPLRDLVRHTAIYGSGFAATAAAGLILVPLYTHYLTPAEYGLFALMFVLYGLAKPVYDLGFTNSVARFFFDDSGSAAEHGDVRRMSSTGLAFLAAFGGTLSALLWVFAPELSRLATGGPEHDGLVRIVVVMLYADTLAIVPLTVIRMQERSTAFVLLTVARLLAALVLSVVFVAVMDLGVKGALLGSALPAVLVLVFLLPEFKRLVGDRPSGELLRQMLAFGLPFFPVLMSTWVIDASDRYLLELFADREQVGLYALGFRVASVMGFGIGAFSLGWAPLRYRIYAREDAVAVYRQLTNYYAFVAGLVAVALAVFAAPIVALVAPPSYAPAAGVVPLLVLGVSLQGLYYLTLTGMAVTKKTKPLASIAVAGALVNIGLNIVLIPEWGMKAAAGTTAGAYGVMVLGSWLFSQRAFPVAYDWWRIGRVLGLCVVAVTAVALVAPDEIPEQLGVGLAAWVGLLAVMIFTRTVTPADLAAGRAWSRSVTARLRRSEVST